MKKEWKANRIKFIGLIFVVIFLVIGFSVLEKMKTEVSFASQTEIEKNFFEEQPKGKILIFYSKTCPYCRAGITQIKTEAKNTQEKIFFVDGTSDFGKKLKEKYNVRFASTIVVWNQKGIQKNFLYGKEVENQKQADTKNIKEAFQFVRKEKIE